jgi:hypothetical protein
MSGEFAECRLAGEEQSNSKKETCRSATLYLHMDYSGVEPGL